MATATATTHSLKAAATPPPGQVSDLTNPENELWRFNVVAQCVCTVIAGILFCLRCYIRLGFSRLPRHWILEDWCVVLSFIGLLLYGALLAAIMKHGGGVHVWNLTVTQADNVYYYFWWETIVYGPFMFAAKLSILLMYLRILIPQRWSFLWTTVHIFIWISASFYMAITLVKIFQCTPVRKAWAKSVHGHCINTPVLLCVSGMFNTVSDLFILLVPVKACWNLKMSRRKKIGVCAIFTIGAIAPIFSAIGFSARWTASRSIDTTYENPRMLLWVAAEVTTGVICVCLPTLPTLVRRRKPNNATAGSRSYNISSDRSYPPKAYAGHKRYIELDDIATAAPSREVVTTVTAGAKSDNTSNDSSLGHEEWISKEPHEETVPVYPSFADMVSQNGIMKTVKIEQTGRAL